MRVAILQPTYLGWAGFYEMLASVDTYVAYDHVQLKRKSFQTRQRLKGDRGPIWLRIPLRHGRRDMPLYEAEIDQAQPWSENHWKSIVQAYRKAPFWRDYEAGLAAKYDNAHCSGYDMLSDWNIGLIYAMCDWLGIETKIVRSSDFVEHGVQPEQGIVSICRAVGATCLYDAAGAEPLHAWDVVREAGIKLTFQKYEHPVYRQLHGEFIPYLSALDCILNEGPKAREIILSGGRT